MRRAQRKIELVELRLELFAVQPRLQQPLDGFAQAFPDRLPAGGLGVAELEHKIGLEDLVLDIELHVLRELRGEDRALERRGVGIRQIRGEDVRGGQLFAVAPAPEDLTEDDVRLFGGLLGRARGVIRRFFRGRDRRLYGDLMPDPAAGVAGQVFFVDQRQYAVQRHGAVEPESGVGGVIELAVRIEEPLARERGDRGGVAAGIEAVGAVGEEHARDPLIDQRINVGVGALHLVEDHALIDRRILRRTELVMPALLPEDVGLGIDGGTEDRVEIDLGEVQKILRVAARDRIDRLIRVGHRV